MRVGVLGATGMLGQHTARALRERGHDLVVLHRASSKLGALRDVQFEARVIDLDVADSLSQGFAGLDGLVHCAAYYPTTPEPWKREVEVAGQQLHRVLDAARVAQVGRIVYVGAAIALKRRSDGRPATEADEYTGRPRDRAPYLQVKYEMDRIARARAAAGVPVAIAVPAMTFGEYDRGPTTGRLIVDIANRSLPAYIHGRRNVIYAGDAARGIALVLERGKFGERYLLTNTDIEMAALVRLIADVAGVPPPRIALPLPLARLISRLQEARYRLVAGALPSLSSTAIAVVASGQYLDGSKARQELGFSSQVSLEETVRRSLGWFTEVGYVRSKSASVRPVATSNAE